MPELSRAVLFLAGLSLFGCGRVGIVKETPAGGDSATGGDTQGATDPCTVTADCDDGSDCTDDLCTAGVCEHTPIACGPYTGGCDAGRCLTGKRLEINFGRQIVPGWNNWDEWPGAASSIYDFVDTRGWGTNVGIRLLFEHGVYQWGEFNAEGVQTGDDSGLFPDAVMLEPMWFGGPYISPVFETGFVVFGLDPARRYRFTFFASREADLDARITRYTIGTRWVELEVLNNVRRTAILDDITAPEITPEGEVTVVMEDIGRDFGYISALVIDELIDPPFADQQPPAIQLLGPREIAITTGQAFVDPGATAFDDLDGDLTAGLLVTNPVNTTSNGSFLVEYSATDSSGNVGTAQRPVYVYDPDKVIQITFEMAGGDPPPVITGWNVFDADPRGDVSFSPLLDTGGIDTGFGIRVVNEGGTTEGQFADAFEDGSVGGGIYADDVLSDGFWVAPGSAAGPNLAPYGLLELHGLDPAKTYDLDLFGDYDGWQNQTFYEITGANSEPVVLGLDATRNKTEIATALQVHPNPAGIIRIYIRSIYPGQGACINALIIRELTP